MENYFVPLTDIISNYELEKIYLPENYEKINIYSNDVNRPGLQLAGFFDYFDEKRIQVMGKVETTFLSTFDSANRRKALYELFSKKPPVVVVTRSLEIFPEALEVAKECLTPLVRTDYTTSNFMSSCISFLNERMAPSVTRHGELVEVYGEGVLMLGESGVGKSETAIELVKRGHRLIADDAVDIRRISDKTLIGSAPPMIRHFIEIRGIGIVNVRNIFGMGAVNDSQRIDLVIKLEIWNEEKNYDRLGDNKDYEQILGVRIPSIVVPVRPGRNLAVIIEVAAMNNRQKKMGYDALDELNLRFSDLPQIDDTGDEKGNV